MHVPGRALANSWSLLYHVYLSFDFMSPCSNAVRRFLFCRFRTKAARAPQGRRVGALRRVVETRACDYALHHAQESRISKSGSRSRVTMIVGACNVYAQPKRPRPAQPLHWPDAALPYLTHIRNGGLDRHLWKLIAAPASECQSAPRFLPTFVHESSVDRVM